VLGNGVFVPVRSSRKKAPVGIWRLTLAGGEVAADAESSDVVPTGEMAVSLELHPAIATTRRAGNKRSKRFIANCSFF